MSISYGGQAVIEGVMMKGPSRIGLAVRKPDGSIALEQEAVNSWTSRYKIMTWPLIRGTFMLIESLVLGMKMLNKSVNLAMAEEEEELSGTEMAVTGVVAFVVAMALFVALPTVVVHFTKSMLGGVFLQNVVEGIIRIALLLGYIVLITRMDEIERVFMYHGAEHKVINAYEAGSEMTVEQIRKYSTLHPRCGTAFLLIVMVVSIFVFAMLGEGSIWWRVGSRIICFPIVAGIGYEFIRFSGRYGSQPWARWIIAPGLWMQKLTTREPDDDQLAVALESLNLVLEDGPRAA
ncbi:MAG: DUF1385 domain-containing protein [Methylocystaceae bacterium]